MIQTLTIIAGVIAILMYIEGAIVACLLSNLFGMSRLKTAAFALLWPVTIPMKAKAAYSSFSPLLGLMPLRPSLVEEDPITQDEMQQIASLLGDIDPQLLQALQNATKPDENQGDDEKTA